MVAAHGAVRASLEAKLLEAHGERVVREQSADQRLARADDQLDGFGRLDRAHHARQHAEHARLCAVRHETLGRRRGKQAAIAGAAIRYVRHRLPFEAMDRRGDERLAQDHAGVVREIARAEAIRAVEHDVVALEQLQHVVGAQLDLVRDELDLRIEREQALRGPLRPSACRRSRCRR